jgi:hypothetical protein
VRVNLGQLDFGVRHPTNALESDVATRIAGLSGAGERWDQMIERLQQNYRYIEIEKPQQRTLLGTPARQIGMIMLTPMGRRMFERAVVEGKGRVSLNTLATITNDILRQANLGRPAQGEEENPPPR